jgi:CPA2 family monovalent cation:H+ antiporter-2
VEAHDSTRLFVDLGLLVAAALAGGLLAQLLRQPLVVGYILGGIAIGPFTPGPTLADPEAFQLFADIGVVLLMFSAGLDFSVRELLRTGRVAVVGAPVGIAALSLLSVGVGSLLGWPLVQSLVVGASVSVASTMVLVRFLQERGELQSPHGRVVVAITLAEDLAVVALTVLLPALAPGSEQRLAAFGRALVQAAVLLVPLLWVARRVVPGLLARVARTRNVELFLLVALGIAISTAALTAGMGLSLALGAFLAGLVISESEFAHEALNRVLPVRDVFVATFFVSVGTLVRPQTLLTEPGTVVGILTLVVLGKFCVWYGLVRAFRYDARTAALAGLALTQIGEFSYILAGVGRAHGLVDQRAYEGVLAASLVSILLNAVLFRRMPGWLERRLGLAAPETPASAPEGAVLLCGFGRVGRRVAEAFDAFGVPYTVVDSDPDAVQEARRRGRAAGLGDAGDPAVLRRAGAERARLAVVTVPDFAAAVRAVRSLRRLRQDLPVLVRVHHDAHRAALREAGAVELVQPELEAAFTLVRHALAQLGVEGAAVRAYLQRARGQWPEGTAEEAWTERWEAREVRVDGPEVVGRSFEEARLSERTGAIVVSVTQSGREVVNPDPSQVLHRGDRLLAIGTSAQLDALEELCEPQEVVAERPSPRDAG